MSKDLSIIVPIYNEEDNLAILHQSIISALNKLNLGYEIIYVDDGSNDGSFSQLQKLKNENTKVIRFRKNFGQTSAMQAGIDFSSGEAVIMLDADLQNDANDIPKLLEKYHQGYDLVSGWRKCRKDTSLRTIPSKIANYIISKTTGINLHDTGCTLKVYNGKILRQIRLFGDHHRFIPVVFSQYSDKITEVEVNHQPRLYGKSKYNISRTIRVIIDLIALSYWQKYRNCPMYFWGRIAIQTFLFSIILLLLSILNMFQIPIFYLYNVVLVELFSIFFITSFVFIGIGLLFESNLRLQLTSNGTKNYDIETIL